MIEEINRGTRKTRKPHRCHECCHTIPAGSVVEFFTGKYDYIYTLYFHPDCRVAADHWRANNMYWLDYDEGTPPLIEELHDTGQFDDELQALRGHFPHVVCRMEFWSQRK